MISILIEIDELFGKITNVENDVPVKWANGSYSASNITDMVNAICDNMTVLNRMYSGVNSWQGHSSGFFFFGTARYYGNDSAQSICKAGIVISFDGSVWTFYKNGSNVTIKKVTVT